MHEASSPGQSGMYRYLPKLSFCGDFIIRGGWRLGPRTLDEYEIVYFPVGSKSACTVGGNTYRLDEPCYIITKPNETHVYDFDAEKPIRHIFCHFVLESPVYISLPTFLKAEGIPHVLALLKYIVYLASKAELRYLERTSALLLSIVEELVAIFSHVTCDERPKAVPMQITEALVYLEEHISEPVNIHELAVRIGWSHEYFTRLFVRYVGLSPKQYVLRRRIEQACELLRGGSLFVKEIADFVGFQSEQYFCRAFVKSVGISATKYRERYADPRLLNLDLAPTGDIGAPYPLNRMFGPIKSQP